MKKLILLFLITMNACIFQACNTSGGGDKGAAANATDTGADPTNDSINNSNTLTAENAVNGDGKDFISKAASSGMLEVEGGKLARSKGMSQWIKNFGTMMVTDHTRANDELKALAVKKQVSLPDVLLPADQAHLDEMKKMSGADFDKHYIKMMAEGHTKVADLFEQESKNEIDPDLKSFAAKTLPVIKMHLDSAKAINSAINKM